MDTIRVAVELRCGGAAAFSLPEVVVMAAKVTRRPGCSVIGCAGGTGTDTARGRMLQLVARGLTDANIRESGISPRTVQHHITNILNKLNCRNRSFVVAQVIGSPPPLSLVRPPDLTIDDEDVSQTGP